MNKDELLSKRNIEGLVQVFQSLIGDRKLLSHFEVDPIGTLAELGVEFDDKRIAKSVAERLKPVIEETLALTPYPDPLPSGPIPVRPFPIPRPDPVPRMQPDPAPDLMRDPVGPVAAAAATTAVATAVATGVVSGVHSVTTSEGVNDPLFKFTHVKLDFSKVRQIEKMMALDREIGALRAARLER